MEMIAHQAIGVHLPLGFQANLAQRREKPLAVLVVPEDSLPLVPATQDVINRSGILDAQVARHAQGLTPRTQSVNSE